MASVLRRTVLALLALTTAVGAGSVAAPADARPAGLAVTGWALAGDAPAVVASNASGLSTLSVDGVTLRRGGASVTRAGSDASRLARAGRDAGLKVELLVSNYSSHLGDFSPALAHRLLSSPAHRRQVARALAAQVRQGQYDGVNVDLEVIARQDAARLAAFVRALQHAMPRARTVSIDISAATTVRGYAARGYDLRRLARAADLIDVMTYDDHGPTWSGPGPIGPLTWQRRAMTALLSRVPARKAQLGFGGYGYTWPAHGTGSTVSDAQARSLVAADGASATWDQAAGEWTARLSDGTVLWWADARSYALRVQLARQLGVHGLAVWRLGSVDRLT